MYVYAESSVRPNPVDTESSAVWNYVRKNIKEVEREENGETVTIYTYEEMKIRKEDYDIFLDTQQNTADIEYIAAMTDVEL